MTLSRRAFLGGLGALAACGRAKASDPDLRLRPSTTVRPNPFSLGVASGDPQPDSVVLWTRVMDDAAPRRGDVPVSWEVRDLTGEVVAGGDTVAEERWAHSVHVVADGLAPATPYWYRFRVGDATSVEGRTRTAPAPDEAHRVSMAVASCQRYDEGYYRAHASIAEADIDLVVFLGDYIYEAAQRPEAVRPLPDGPAEATDLAGYRGRYAGARLDEHLAAAHAAHPWVVIWDDHEVYDDVTADVDPQRRAAAYQAWWEHQPVRLPPPDGPSLEMHRRLRWGSLLDLLLLDTRQFRSAGACASDLLPPTCEELDDPSRTMLGREQEAWLEEQVAAGRSDPAAWTGVVQGVAVGNLEVRGLASRDGWDGYPIAQERMLDVLRRLPDPVVLSGDLHIELVADVVDDAGAPVATEFFTPSVTSWPGNKLADGEPASRLPRLDDRIRFASGDRRGWMRCDLDDDSWRTTYVEVTDARDPASQSAEGARFRVDRGTPGATVL